jgi:uncharacterized protein DUF4231
MYRGVRSPDRPRRRHDIVMSAATTVTRGAVSTRSRTSLIDRLGPVIDGLAMDDDKKMWMRNRWLEQLTWFDQRAESSNRKHNYLRVIAIAGGVLIPGLVSVHEGSSSLWLWDWVRPLAFIVSLMVAGAVGLDEFFHFGERWRHFRRTAELLKTEGWLFIEGGGRYKVHQHKKDFHNRFFPVFATKVEEIIRRDVEVYLTRIVQEKQEDGEREDEELQKYSEASERSESDTDSEDGSPSGTEQGSTVAAPE